MNKLAIVIILVISKGKSLLLCCLLGSRLALVTSRNMCHVDVAEQSLARKPATELKIIILDNRPNTLKFGWPYNTFGWPSKITWCTFH